MMTSFALINFSKKKKKSFALINGGASYIALKLDTSVMGSTNGSCTWRFRMVHGYRP